MASQELVKQTLDQIPQTNANAKRIVSLVKEGAESPVTSFLTTLLWKSSRRWIWQSRDKSLVWALRTAEIPNT